MLTEHRALLLSLFESLQRLRADPYGRARECQAIQNTLLERIMAAEGRIQSTKQLAASLRRRLSTPQPVRLTRVEANDVKAAVASHEDAIETDELLIDVLRDVGDGLAFTYIDKWDIKPMAFKQAPGYLSGKVGQAFELEIVNKAFEGGGIAVLNDLTHCLRYGDVTLIRGGAIAIIEAKAGQTLNQRGKRQWAANDMISEYLRTDRVAGLYGHDAEFQRIDLAHPEVNHIPALQAMIDEAFERDGAYRQVEPGLHYMVDTGGATNGFKVGFPAIKSKPCICIVNELKRDNTAYYPFPLSITNPERLYAFYNGEFVITIAVETDHVARFFKSRGFTTTILNNEPWFLSIEQDMPTGEKGPGLKISTHLWDRLFAEFVSLDWLLTEVARKHTDMIAFAEASS